MMRGAIDHYIDEVVMKVKAKEMRPQIQDELYDHLMTRMEEDIRNGIPREAAEADAVKQMGEPQETARRLNQVHKYRWPWMLWVLIGALLGLTVAAMYVYQMSASASGEYYFAAKQGINVFMGLLLLIAVCCIDYRKLLNKGPWIFGGMLAVNCYAEWSGWGLVKAVNGAKYILLDMTIGGLEIAINPLTLSPFIYLLGLYLWLSHHRSKDKAESARWMEWAVLGVSLIPIYFYLSAPRIFVLILYTAGLVLLYLKWVPIAKRKLITLCGMMMAGGGLTWLSSDIARIRFSRWLSMLGITSGADPYWNDTYQRIVTTIQEAGWFGQGMSIPLDIYGLYNDHLVLFIVHTFGWIGGIAFLAVFSAFIVLLLRLSGQVQHTIGRGIMQLGVTYLLLHTVVYLLGLVNVLPVSEGGFPLMSYGLSNMVPWMVILGLYCNVYIRKDRVPAYAVQ